MKVATVLVLAACGSSGSAPDAANHDAKIADAPADTAIDGPPPTVLTVDCASSTPVATVTANTTLPYAYTIAPGPTIAVGDVVQFQMPGIHNVAPMLPTTDSGLHVGFGETKCLKFTMAGTFDFHCTAHAGLQSAIVVN